MEAADERHHNRFNEAAGVDPADAAHAEPVSATVTASFNEAAGVDPADACRRARSGWSRRPRRFNEAAGVDPADALVLVLAAAPTSLLQ